MGYIRHHAIVVTCSGYDEAYEMLNDVHQKAKDLFGSLVSNIVDSWINGNKSFFVAPDGSKEGWAESDKGDRKRNKLIKYIKSKAYEDGSNAIKYAELFYGDDGREAKIERHN